jgi:ABC-type bacteriocin/lantibiotic exporter with double-glycine peptidase domain
MSLFRFRDSKCLIVFTHSDAMMTIANQLSVMDQGAVLTTGTYDEVMNSCHPARESAVLKAVSSFRISDDQ